jgi:hypothetical protein
MLRRTTANTETNTERKLAGTMLVAQEVKGRAWGLRISAGGPMGKIKKNPRINSQPFSEKQ